MTDKTYTQQEVVETMTLYAGMMISDISEHNPVYFERIKAQPLNDFFETIEHVSNSQMDLKSRLDKALGDAERWQDNCAEMSDEVVKLQERLDRLTFKGDIYD